jgi:hypothetical protein
MASIIRDFIWLHSWFSWFWIAAKDVVSSSPFPSNKPSPFHQNAIEEIPKKKRKKKFPSQAIVKEIHSFSLSPSAPPLPPEQNAQLKKERESTITRPKNLNTLELSNKLRIKQRLRSPEVESILLCEQARMSFRQSREGCWGRIGETLW